MFGIELPGGKDDKPQRKVSVEFTEDELVVLGVFTSLMGLKYRESTEQLMGMLAASTHPNANDNICTALGKLTDALYQIKED